MVQRSVPVWGVGADHGEHDAEACAGQATQRGVAREHGDHGDAEDGEGQKFGRAHEQDQRTHQREDKRHEDGAKQAAHQRGHIGGAERPRAFAALRHRIAVECGRSRGCMARCAQNNGGNRIAMGCGCGKAEQQRHRGRRVHAVGEGQQEGHAGQPADAGENAKGKSAQDTAPQQRHPVKLGDDRKTLAQCVKPFQHDAHPLIR